MLCPKLAEIPGKHRDPCHIRIPKRQNDVLTIYHDDVARAGINISDFCHFRCGLPAATSATARFNHLRPAPCAAGAASRAVQNQREALDPQSPRISHRSTESHKSCKTKGPVLNCLTWNLQRHSQVCQLRAVGSSATHSTRCIIIFVTVIVVTTSL